jgi:membrane protease YdiL (CAAX protease family)
MTSPSEPRTPRLYHAFRGAPGFDPLLAGAIVAAAMGTFHAVSAFVPRPAALIVAQLVLLAIPLGAAALVPGPDGRLAAMRDRLGFRLPRPIFLVAAALIGATAWYVNLRLVSLLEIHGDTRRLEEAAEQPSLPFVLLTLAVLPPLCEETLFRGVLARSLTPAVGVMWAVFVSAVLFSAYHLNLVQAGPTFTLGLALGFLAIRADSAIPTMLAHALNNAVAITIARNEVPGLGQWFEDNPTIALVLCATATLVGVVLIALAGRQTT